VATASELGGVTFDRTVTYQLTALDDEHATIALSGHLTAPPQTLSVDPHTTSELTHAVRDDVGEIKIAFHHVVPSESARATSDFSFSIARKRQQVSSTIQAEMAVTVRPR
jgi:hypothetical protein